MLSSLFPDWHHLFRQRIEGRRVAVLDQMTHLVHDHISDQLLRHLDQLEVQCDLAFGGAGTTTTGFHLGCYYPKNARTSAAVSSPLAANKFCTPSGPRVISGLRNLPSNNTKRAVTSTIRISRTSVSIFRLRISLS